MTVAPTSLLILGAGGLAADLAALVAAVPGMTVAGFIEGVDRARCAAPIDGLPVHWIDDVAPLADSHAAVGAIGDPARRAALERLAAMGFSFATVVHPGASVAAGASLGEGSVVGAGCVVGAAAAIGRHVYLNRGALVGHHSRIGDFATVGPGVNVAARCDIGAGCFVGIGATLVDGIILGPGTVVAAGAVVTRDFPDGGRIGGAPARPLARAGG